jgi:hypothetical protein
MYIKPKIPRIILKKAIFINNNLDSRPPDLIKMHQNFTNDKDSKWIATKSHLKNDMEMLSKFLEKTKVHVSVVHNKMRKFHEHIDLWYK